MWAAFFRGLLPESRRLFLRRYFFGDGIGPLAVAARQNEVAVHDQLSHLRQQLVQRLEEAGALPPDGAALFAALEGARTPGSGRPPGSAPRAAGAGSRPSSAGAPGWP